MAEHADAAASALNYAAPMLIEDTAAHIANIREVNLEARTISGVICPYGEVSYLTPFPGGERVLRGAFTRSVAGRERSVRLFVGHHRASEAACGISRSIVDGVRGLQASFTIKRGTEGDRVLEDAEGGYFGGFSVEFADARREIGRDGVSEVRQARLIACSLVGTPAYDGAQIGAPDLVGARAAGILERFGIGPRPVVDLTPVWITNRWGNPQRLA